MESRVGGLWYSMWPRLRTPRTGLRLFYPKCLYQLKNSVFRVSGLINKCFDILRRGCVSKHSKQVQLLQRHSVQRRLLRNSRPFSRCRFGCLPLRRPKGLHGQSVPRPVVRTRPRRLTANEALHPSVQFCLLGQNTEGVEQDGLVECRCCLNSVLTGKLQSGVTT